MREQFPAEGALLTRACRFYDWLEDRWSPFVKEPGLPLVRLIDLFRSECVYCTAWRAVFVGITIGFLAAPLAAYAGAIVYFLAALVPVALVAGLVWLERVACRSRRIKS